MRRVSTYWLEVPLRIALDTIPRSGRVVGVDIDAEWATTSVAEALDATPSTLTGQIDIAQPVHKRVGVEVDVRVTAELACDRCAELTILEVHASNQLQYKPLPSDVDDAELQAGDLDVGWYTDRALDLGDVLAEAVTLSIPARITCKDAESCEARTNAMLAEQRPTSDVGHPGFAALRTISE